jgi:hypothetical protein
MSNTRENTFKIKINCTHKWQLNYCGKKVKQNIIYNEIKSGIIFSNIEDSYIDKILILHKSYGRTTNKTFEFFTNMRLTETDFTRFIYTIHLNGFQSESADTLIQFIDTKTNEVIYNYSFNEIQEVPIPEIIRKKNKSKYNAEMCFCKK